MTDEQTKELKYCPQCDVVYFCNNVRCYACYIKGRVGDDPIYLIPIKQDNDTPAEGEAQAKEKQ